MSKSIYILQIGLLLAMVSCDHFSDRVTQPSLAQNDVTIPDAEVFEGDSLLFKNREGKMLYQDELYSGYIIGRYERGNIKSKKGYFNGLLEGNSITYYKNGSLKSKRPYENGEKQGKHIGWYNNKQIKFDYHFVNGKSEGSHKNWYQDGSLMKDFNYKNGRPFGSQKVWRKDGKYRANYVIRENGKKYGLTGLKRCTKIDTKTEDIDPYTGIEQ